MADAKTQPTTASVDAYLERIAHEERRADCRALVAWMSAVTGEPATMWGPSIVGFGSYHYRYESGREGDAPLAGFAYRKPEICFYGLAGESADPQLLARLGKHRAGKGCVYLKHLADVDPDALQALILAHMARLRRRYP